MKHLVPSYIKNDSGATAVEYGLIAALVSVAMIGMVLTLSEKVSGLYKTVAEAVPVEGPASPPPEGG